MEFLRNVFHYNIIFEKLPLHETLVTGRVRAIYNKLHAQSNAAL